MFQTVSMLDFLKKVLPRVLLKRAFFIFNRVKIATFDRLLFPAEPIDDSDFLMKSEKNPFRELRIDIGKLSDNIRSRLKIWEDPAWTQDQYVLVFRGFGYIDSDTGWGITRRRHLIYPSLGFAKALYVKKPRLSSLLFRLESVVKLQRIISLRDTGEENYFHFYNDVLAKLYFLQETGFVLENYSLVVARRLFERPYFKAAMSISKFRALNWHIQGKEAVEFQEAVFCKPFTHSVRFLRRCVIDLSKSRNVDAQRRIFLTRSRSSFRFIDNEEELLPILDRYHFEVIDTGMISLGEQITIFQQCRYLVAVHGAGIVNIIYRMGGKLNLLEIIGPSQDYIPFHYIMLCELFQFEYNAILGTSGKAWGKGGFNVDPFELEISLRAMIR